MASGTGLVHLSLTDIADRISDHLRRIEAEQRAARKPEDQGLGGFFNAGASRAGSRVHVIYVSYQGGSNLTREQALHFLALLDRGEKGRHFEIFRRFPLPAKEQAEARYRALVRGGMRGFFLYEVTKRTEKRLYGRAVGESYSPEFVDRSDVVKLRATEEDLAYVEGALKRRARAIEAANRDYQEAIDLLMRESRGELDEEEADAKPQEQSEGAESNLQGE